MRQREFFQHVLRCARHKHYRDGTAGDKRDCLTEWLVARAQRSPINSAVIFIDEAHLLTEQHFNWLLNIGNEMDASGCRLFCLLVGQAELAKRKVEYIGEGLEQIVGRFMVRELDFPAIKSQEEVEECYSQFHDTHYPTGSEILFPENFLPRAVADGFHLKNLAPASWSAFEKEWHSVGLDSDPLIPMHYLTATLTGILNALVSHDAPSLSVQSKIIRQAVRESGYLESIQSLKVALTASY